MILLILFIVFTLICCPLQAIAKNSEYTAEDYRAYFSSLSQSEKQDFIEKTIQGINESYPATIDEYREITSIVYFSNINTVMKYITFNVDYSEIDKTSIEQNKRQQHAYSVNSICTGDLFRTWLFQADIKIRNNYRVSSGQNLYNITIDKEDCLQAGYEYP